MEINLIREIIGKPWAIEPIYASIIGSSVHGLLEQAVTYKSTWQDLPTVKQDYEDIQIVHVKGELLKNDTSSGKMGMRTIGELIRAAEINDNLKGSILLIDSPGGTVDGTMELVQVIAKAQKPIVSFVDGMAASAGYWIAAATNNIICGNDFAKVGSIGVMLSFADVQPYYEAQGVKFHRINATQSTDKNKVFEELLKGNYDEYRNSDLNPLADEFIRSVNSFRNLSKEQITGKTFFAKDVLGTMVDSIGTLDDCANFIYQNSKNKNTMFKQKTQVVVVGADNSATPTFTEADFLSIQAQLEEAKIKLTSLEEENRKILAVKSEIEKQLSTAKEEIEELKKIDGAQSATIVKTTDANQAVTAHVVSDNLSFEENFQKMCEIFNN